MSMRGRIMAAASAVYIVGGFLTFGWYINHGTCYSVELCRDERIALAGIVGVFWPVHWASKFSIEVTR
jgi:hypothetical protein